MTQPSDNPYDPPEDSQASLNDATALSNGSRRAAMPFILLTLFLDILGIGIIVPVLPELVKELAATETVMIDGVATVQVDDARAGRYVGIIGAAYALMQFFFAPILGALSDRFGRRPIILGSLFGFGIDFLIQGFAPNITWLFVGRIFAGIMGASFTTANAYIADISTAENRARNFGMVGMMFGLGFIIGPALGGLLGGYSLRLPFFVAAGLALANWLYGYFVLPESLAPENRSSFTLRKANPVGALVHLRKYPIVAGLAMVFVGTSLAQRGLESVWVLYTGFRYQWDELTNGLALCLVGFTSALVQGGMVRPMIKRLGERRTAKLGIIVSALAFMGYGLASQGWMIPLVIVFGSLGGLAGPAIQSIVASTVDPNEQGKVQGALTSLISLTNIGAPLLFTYFLFSYFTSSDAIFELPGAPFLTGSLLIFVSFLIITVVFRRFPAEPQSPVTAPPE
ncbi:MAG: TCR/Tet family MFS transporter [Pirellulales bacterium]|nr:TCR/Tet family MFS transporter [Pirellulales bacterium]